jgi:hypothetical protein
MFAISWLKGLVDKVLIGVVGNAVAGLGSFASGMALILTSCSLFCECLRGIPAVLVVLMSWTLIVRVAVVPLRIAGLSTFGWWDAFNVAGVLAIPALNLKFKYGRCRFFFTVLDKRDDALSKELKDIEVDSGLMQLFQAFALGTVGIAAMIACLTLPAIQAGFAIFFSSYVVALGAGLFAMICSSWMIAGVVGGIVLLLCVLVGVKSLMAPFMWIARQVDPVLALIVVVMIWYGKVRTADIKSLIYEGTILYYACSVATRKLLEPYVQRVTKQYWESFKNKYRWRLFGFGLPLFVLGRQYPGACAILLEAE